MLTRKCVIKLGELEKINCSPSPKHIQWYGDMYTSLKNKKNKKNEEIM